MRPFYKAIPAEDNYSPRDEDLAFLRKQEDDSLYTAPRQSNATIPILAALLLISLAGNAFLAAFISFQNFDRICSRHTSQHNSYVLKNVDVTYSSTHFNSTLFRSNIYRDHASPAVDEAWRQLGTDYRGIIIPPEEGIASGLGPYHLQVAGGGYAVNVEVLHQLHCLDIMRKGSHWDYEYYKDDPLVMRRHFAHCLDNLRQQIMCTADTGVVGQIWVDSIQSTWPDFSTTHKCKNFDAIRQWVEDNQAPDIPGALELWVRPGQPTYADFP